MQGSGQRAVAQLREHSEESSRGAAEVSHGTFAHWVQQQKAGVLFGCEGTVAEMKFLIEHIQSKYGSAVCAHVDANKSSSVYSVLRVTHM
jgi:hypothetical protein